jgi:hypothetical protein
MTTMVTTIEIALERRLSQLTWQKRELQPGIPMVGWVTGGASKR